jgi:PEP-CTERM motif
VALAAATCQATVLSTLTLTHQSSTEPVSASSGGFGTYAVSGIVNIFLEHPFLPNTDYYVPFQDLHLMNEMIAHPEDYDSHGPVFGSIQGTGLGSYQPHNSYFGSHITDSSCTIGQGPCDGTLTIDGTPAVYTVPWNEVKMRYTYTGSPATGYVSSLVVTISNVPEPASALLVAIGLIAPTFGSRRRR